MLDRQEDVAVPTQKDSDRYEIDPIDGLRRAIVGSWAPEKHLRLQRYVDITRATRRKFQADTTYIDLYCGAGRARIKNTQTVVDGSALVVAKEAAKHVPFGEIIIGDIDLVNVQACQARLDTIRGTQIRACVGSAEDVAAQIVPTLPPKGLHLAFLDPFNIETLPFTVIRTLAQLQRMDLLIHVSLMDLQRNVRSMMESGKMDRFAPGWQDHINPALPNPTLVVKVFEHWRSLLEGLGYTPSANIERVTGNRNQPLYWLVLASRHPLGDQFWTEVSQVEPQTRLPF